MNSEQERPPAFLTRVRVENYRSIASCDVKLGPLTVLAGPNAAGKSNFLDAIRFVRDALASSPGRALEPRGGLEEVLHRHVPGRRADSFRITLDLSLPASERPPFDAIYILEIGCDAAVALSAPNARRPSPSSACERTQTDKPVLRRDEVVCPRRPRPDGFPWLGGPMPRRPRRSSEG
ncbi:AAA family ATPase [Streptomyces mirabilis]|uniref:AAA family ATPase n=1 Tax=Streptomyces mirabilis TaxID=68239 RepID=UPI0033337B95